MRRPGGRLEEPTSDLSNKARELAGEAKERAGELTGDEAPPVGHSACCGDQESE
ncbi:hypothetical protein ACWDD9_34105 [Kitasatospora sp. NPDC001119]